MSLLAGTRILHSLAQNIGPKRITRDQTTPVVWSTSWKLSRHGEHTPTVTESYKELIIRATKGLGASAVILFILGNVLLFYPLPSKQETCYHASPMLWWGVMAVTGVGWFLVGQVLVVVLIIGVGGPLILVSLFRWSSTTIS